MSLPIRGAMPLAAALLLAVAQAPAPSPAMVAVERAWSRATPGAAREGALYLTLRAATADRLVAVSTPAAGMAMLHESREVGGVVQMRDLDGLSLPAGQPVAMRPGGVHVMLMQLAHPLAQGQHFPVTLRFEHAPALTADVTVARAGAVTP